MLTQPHSQETRLNSIKFQKGDFTSIYQAIDSDHLRFSGYWQFTLDRTPKMDSSLANIWYLYFSKGKIVFSSSQEVNFPNILEALKNYLPALRNPEAEAQTQIDKLTLLTQKESNVSLLKLLIKLTLDTKLFEYTQVIEAIQKHIVNGLEQYLFNSSGTINIVFDQAVDIQKPIVGFDLENILDTIEQRNIQWPKLREIIPFLNVSVKCNEQHPQWRNLSVTQKQKIKKLVNSGSSLQQIKYNLGEDDYKITQIFAKLFQKKLVTFGSDDPSQVSANLHSSNRNIDNSSSAEVAIIDDSTVLLQQFKAIVTNWGYTVRSCNDALAAVDFLLKSPPKIIFLDVNMPHLSGFDLIKQIRMQTKLNSIPLVILTAENTMMNNYRAKWSKSTFLSKPLHKDDVNSFKFNLKNLLEKMLISSQ